MEFPIGSTWLILDEIHKYNKWRNLVKGIFDIEGTARKIIVTGSARLDYYRKGGDSLIGRYRYFRLHPFSLNEVSSSPSEKDLARLLKFGGFPEPFLSQDPAEHRIWQRDRMSKVIREDLRDLENVREISLLEHLADILPSRVGSPLSIKSLREDLEVDHKSVSRWLQIFENLYISFRISPYGAPKIRAVKKEQKLYLWDWSLVEDPGSRFENLVACQLLKYCHWMEDVEGYKMDLRFIRDTDKREIDFVVLKQGKPEFAVECKTGDKALSPHLNYFEQRTLIPRFYQVHQGSQSFSRGKFYLLPFTEFCKKMKMP
jgi:predicted AAA+ superfamily ATPase